MYGWRTCHTAQLSAAVESCRYLAYPLLQGEVACHSEVKVGKLMDGVMLVLNDPF